jgi:hypothetical protein
MLSASRTHIITLLSLPAILLQVSMNSFQCWGCNWLFISLIASRTLGLCRQECLSQYHQQLNDCYRLEAVNRMSCIEPLEGVASRNPPEIRSSAARMIILKCIAEPYCVRLCPGFEDRAQWWAFIINVTGFGIGNVREFLVLWSCLMEIAQK